MIRSPFQVLVYPYRKVYDDDFEYALLKRSDAGYWQAIAGGEDNETHWKLPSEKPMKKLAFPLNQISFNWIPSNPFL